MTVALAVKPTLAWSFMKLGSIAEQLHASFIMSNAEHGVSTPPLLSSGAVETSSLQ